MNKKGYGGAEAEYIRRYHKHGPADHQYSSLLITHIRPPIHPINAAEFTCPFWFSPAAKLLIDKILDPNPKTRIKIERIKNNPWFRVNYIPIRQGVEEEVNLDDVHTVFEDIEDQHVTDSGNNDIGPLVMNAFEMITLSQGLNLSVLFDRRQVCLLKF
ncbi:hypothetical protein Nepgr_027338 [Nepenthes gracilis]|uniref:non-specific serine/threonine protein kinase n=1 Tax=Nepenthes gracilis TaxID=150966 RepID=A0AAD3T9P8_NEPGR|nr:hypothetical protein Nepgr_027338 [Nepenthes gracilis]